MMDEHMKQKVEAAIHAARRFVQCADEFWPEYPEAISEHFEALAGAVAAVGDDQPEPGRGEEG